MIGVKLGLTAKKVTKTAMKILIKPQKKQTILYGKSIEHCLL